MKKNFHVLLLAAIILFFSAEAVFSKGQGEKEGPAELHVLGSWSATEGEVFEAVLDGFRKSTGIKVVYEAGADVIEVLGPRMAAGEFPDIVLLGAAIGFLDLSSQGVLVSLNDMQSELESNFSNEWLEQFTVNGEVFGIPTRANIQSLLWYNPQVVTEVPKDWAAFKSYTEKLAAEGLVSTSGTGKTEWTLTVLFEGAYLSTYGVDKWNALMTGEIPWNDKTVEKVMSRILFFSDDRYTIDGTEGALGTGLVDGIARVFGANADAQFVAGGSWVDGIVKGAINDNVVDDETISFIPFPGEAAGEGSIIASADVAVMLVDSPEAKELMKFLMSTEGQSLFAPAGYTVANKNVDPGLYSGLTSKCARMLSESKVGSEVGGMLTNEAYAGLGEMVQNCMLNPDDVAKILQRFEDEFGL